VGALTSKPFRYSARTWELSRRKSVSPHDSTGANLIVQVKNNQVMRVVPFENEAVNECWIADRDRFSYEALNGEDRLTKPMLKQGGQWKEVDWQTALEYVANGLKQIKTEQGADAVGALLSPHSTLEELYLATQLVRGLGSDNVDARLRHAEFAKLEGVRYLGTSIASLSSLQSALIVGSNLRKDHPLFAQRIRQSARRGCAVNAINSVAYDWAMPVANTITVPAAQWAQALADVAAAIAAEKGVQAPAAGNSTDAAQKIAKSLLKGERKAILLGNAAAHHANASSLLALVNWIGQQTGATVGYLTEAANTVGAQLVGAQPLMGGKNAAQMQSGLKALILLGTEPEHDTAAKAAVQADMVVTLSPFKSNMAFSDVLLPVSPFTETAGTFINAEGRIQSFHGVVKPLGETRPAWKVLRVLGNMLSLPGFDFETAQDVAAKALNGDAGVVSAAKLSNATSAAIDLGKAASDPHTATLYQLDSLTRRSPALQATADAKAGSKVGQLDEVTA
jgi:NADH-quinone oxidoreductase subunit G